jgi:transposase
MTLSIVKHGLIPREYDIFAGLDVDKMNIAVTFLDHEAKIKSMQIPYDSQNLLNYVDKQFPGKKIAFVYEAGPTGYGLHDDLVKHGHRCLVVSPSMVPTAAGQRVKTNRLDSIKLGEGLRGGQLKSIHVPSTSYRELRHLTGLRETFVRQATAAKCRIKGLLLFEGIAFPDAPAGSQWTQSVLKQLKKLSCQGAVRFKLDSLLLSLEFASKQVVCTTKQIRSFCSQDAQIEKCMGHLTSIPGIGRIIASHLLARIGDYREMQNVRQLASFLGLAPSENSTGDTVRKGQITRSGDSRTRNKLIQGAWAAIKRDPELAEFYKRISQRHPKDRASRKAIVAVARKMTTRIYAVLTQQRDYFIHDVA